MKTLSTIITNALLSTLMIASFVRNYACQHIEFLKEKRQRCLKRKIEPHYIIKIQPMFPSLQELSREKAFEELLKKSLNNYDTFVTYLIELPCNVAQALGSMYKNHNNDTLVHLYAGLNNVNRLAYLINIGLNPRAKNNNDETPLYHAAQHANLEAFIFLFTQGGYHQQDYTKRFHEGISVSILPHPKDPIPLLLNMPQREAFLFYKKHIAKKYKNYVALVAFASKHGHFNFLKFLINKIARHASNELLHKCAKIGWQGKSALHLCAEAGQSDKVAFLLKKLHSPYCIDAHYLCPLYYAAAGGHIGCLALLLSCQKIMKKTVTPLHIAAECNQKDAVVYLLDTGADINEIDLNGRTPLVYAAKANLFEIVQLLIERGAQVAEYSFQLIKECINRRHFDMAEYLITNGADVNALYADNLEQEPYSILNLMIEDNNKEGVEFLLNHEAKIQNHTLHLTYNTDLEILKLIEKFLKQQEEYTLEAPTKHSTK